HLGPARVGGQPRRRSFADHRHRAGRGGGSTRGGGVMKAMEAPHSPIALELLRTQPHSIADESAEAVIRTAISPLVNEAKDCGSTLLDADGNLVAGGGTG